MHEIKLLLTSNCFVSENKFISAVCKISISS